MAIEIQIVDTPDVHALPTVCLNMIVKNESRVIRRLLESVADVVDSYCICDTGSTDETDKIIESFFKEKGIPGQIIREPFRDFGYNRSFALKACETRELADYILLLDADMVFWRNPEISIEEFKRGLTTDAYYMYQGSDHFYYKNTRMVRNRRGVSYWGVTHEFVKTPEGTQYGTFEKPHAFIYDIGDGGSKSDKFERDIRLLKQGLVDFPENDRYTFYLANSYRDHGDYLEAIDTYRKRIAIGGWFEEVWHSYFSIGNCYKHLGDMPNAIHAWLDAYQFFPKRIENLYEIVSHYRKQGKNDLAYLFYVAAQKQRALQPSPDYLFLQRDVYEYKLDYEFSIVGYYCNSDHFDMTRICHTVLNNPYTEDAIAHNVLSNYKFYSDHLQIIASGHLSEPHRQLLKNIGKTLLKDSFPEFVVSTPSITLHGTDELVVVQRYVNYRINDKGGYMNREYISTKNVVAVFDIREPDQWVKTQEFEMEYNRSLDGLYVGLEDVRILSHGGEIRYNANRGIHLHHLMVEHGTVALSDTDAVRSGLVLIADQKQIEKNWVLFSDASGKLKIIYGWRDLLIGDIIPEEELASDLDSDDEISAESEKCSFLFSKTHTISTPPFFKYIRGSTNGVLIGDEVWFICHVVSYEDRRYYYHVVVVLDATTYQLKRYTTMFTFTKEKVEYTLGFLYFESTDAFLIGFSKMDREVEYMTITRPALEKYWLYP